MNIPKIISVCSVDFIKWQISSWWKCSIIFLLIAILTVASLWINEFFDIKLVNLFFVIFLLQILFNIFCFFRFLFIKNWLNALFIGITNIVIVLVFSVVTFFSIFMMGMINHDDFADNLKSPENIKLKEPIAGGYKPFDAPAKLSKNYFQTQVINALGKGRTMSDSEEIKIPAIEKLMSSELGRQKLKDYLYAHPEWNVHYTQKNGTYATRNIFHEDGSINSSEFHSKFPTFSSNGEKIGEHWQFFFYISLDGKPWRKNEKSYTDGIYSCWSSCDANGANITIFDQSKYSGRQMTKKILELAENEFTKLELPTNMPQSESFELFNGMQGGMYIMKIAANPGESGTIWIEATEITTNTPLSVKRLSNTKRKLFGSDKSDEYYNAEIEFTIYEGNWEQYYGARIVVKFAPDSGGKERIIHEDNYKIEGWMR